MIIPISMDDHIGETRDMCLGQTRSIVPGLSVHIISKGERANLRAARVSVHILSNQERANIRTARVSGFIKNWTV
jgi:hypothetical protein